MQRESGRDIASAHEGQALDFAPVLARGPPPTVSARCEHRGEMYDHAGQRDLCARELLPLERHSLLTGRLIEDGFSTTFRWINRRGSAIFVSRLQAGSDVKVFPGRTFHPINP